MSRREMKAKADSGLQSLAAHVGDSSHWGREHIPAIIAYIEHLEQFAPVEPEPVEVIESVEGGETGIQETTQGDTEGLGQQAADVQAEFDALNASTSEDEQADPDPTQQLPAKGKRNR